MTATEGQESPEIFHQWVGISLVSAAINRDCWLDREHYILYPNIYVCLSSGSARCRRSTAIKIGIQHVFEKAFPQYPGMCSQKITSAALFKHLHRVYKETEKSCLFLVNDELLTLFGKSASDNELITVLTKLYDSPDEWTYETIVRGRERIDKAYAVFLASSAPYWLRQIIPVDAIGAGFTGRIIFVYQPDTSRRFAFPTITAEQHQAYKDCIHDLQQIGMLGGEFVLTDAAKKYYKHWYEDTWNPDAGGELLEGYNNRKADTVLKLSMLLCVEQRDVLKIEKADVQIALKIMEQNEKYLPYIMKLIEQTEVGEAASSIIQFIQNGDGVVSETALLQAFRHRFSSNELAIHLGTLVKARVLAIDQSRGPQNIKYTLIERKKK